MSRKTLGVSLIFMVFLAVNCGERKAQELLQNCRKLEIGMTRAQVEAIMGRPSSIKQREFRGRSEEMLLYPSPRLASEQTLCVIDKETGLVVEVRCGESYLLTQGDAECAKLRTQMSRDEVLKIMGEPSFIEESEMLGSAEEWLYFVSPRYPRKIIKCAIDKKTGLLIGTYCD